MKFKRDSHDANFQLLGFLKDFIYLFLESGRKGEREGEKHQCVVATHMPPTGNLAHNPGMCPRLGIELATLWFTGRHSIHWAIPARAPLIVKQGIMILWYEIYFWALILSFLISSLSAIFRSFLYYTLSLNMGLFCVLDRWMNIIIKI